MSIKEILLSWGMLILSVLFNVWSIFVIKIKLDEMGPIQFDSFGTVFNYIVTLLRSGLIITALILFFAAPFLFAVALSRMELSIAYPVQIVLSLVVLSLLAVLFLGEHMTPNKIAAIVLAVVCVYLLRK